MKIRFLLLTLTVFTIVGVFCFFTISQHKHIILFADQPESDEGGDAGARGKWELMRLADPSGKIPDHIRAKEMALAATLPKLESDFGSRAAVPIFSSRGPWNVGGRSRALAIDVTNENVVFIGGVNGGLWRSADGGASWSRVSGRYQIPAVNCIVQDTRPGHTNTWYYGTGEGYGTSAGADYAFYTGNGIYKSIDGGLSWDSLPSTYSKTPQGTDGFDLSWNLAMDYSDSVHDVLYTATVGYGIRRSADGGTTWKTDLNCNSYFTEVRVTSTGIVYASASKGNIFGTVSAIRGIYRKQDTVWTKISPPEWDTTSVNRYAIGINPSNENEVYFFGGNTPFHGKLFRTFIDENNSFEWNSLWKYTYLSGNGSAGGGLWQDLSHNLPGDTIKSFYNTYTQGGYDLLVKVDPDSANTVYIGGTNLYRSTDGFTSANNITVIGGYDTAFALPFYRLYPNHHPDQHNLAFLPSDHKVVYQANDGGIFKSQDIRGDSVKWQWMNNGFITGQFYTISIDHGSTPNDIIIGGLQDNGSWFTNNANVTTPWTMPGAGDGSYCHIVDGHQTYYLSRQQGLVAKATLDNSGAVTAFRRIDPISGLKRSDYGFINPFIIDPNNQNAMFMAARNRVWRNDSLDQIALTNEYDSISQGWFAFDSIPIVKLEVTALAMSKNPAGRLYYGTNQRRIYRVDNPYAAHPVAKDITAIRLPTIFPSTGNISCIAVDPTDANRVMVVFSNYGVNSLYYTAVGDTPWVRVAGNLDPSDGTDVSLRWAKIIPVNSGYVYLVGTSIGLFGTSLLDSMRTVWTQLDPHGIGNMVVDMIDYRSSDGLTVVATHGSGVFSAYINDVLPVGVKEGSSPPVTFNMYPNPAGAYATVSLTLPQTDEVYIKVFDQKGTLVQSLPQGKQGAGQHQFTVERKNMAAGIYFVNIRAGNSLNETKKIIFRD